MILYNHASIYVTGLPLYTFLTDIPHPYSEPQVMTDSLRIMEVDLIIFMKRADDGDVRAFIL